VSLLDRIAALLSERNIAHALIGATALAAHGVSRSTMDQDLLVCERGVLDSNFWSTLSPPTTIDVRRGDAEDPLAGVIRIHEPGERDVDVIVGQSRWQEAVLERATSIGKGPLRLVEAADLILLKLYAGGSQDRWDIEQLLALDATGVTARAVERRSRALPLYSREIWSMIRPRR
jgi:hypothetical protein